MISKPIKRSRTHPFDSQITSSIVQDKEAIFENKTKILFTTVPLGPVTCSDQLQSKLLAIQNHRLLERLQSWKKLESRLYLRISQLENKNISIAQRSTIIDKFWFRLVSSVAEALKYMNDYDDDDDDALLNSSTRQNLCLERTNSNQQLNNHMLFDNDELDREVRIIEKFCEFLKNINLPLTLRKTNQRNGKGDNDHLNKKEELLNESFLEGFKNPPLCSRCHRLVRQRNYLELRIRYLLNENLLLGEKIRDQKDDLAELEKEWFKWQLVEAKLLTALNDATSGIKNSDNSSELNQEVLSKNKSSNDNKDPIELLAAQRLSEAELNASKYQDLLRQFNTLNDKISYLQKQYNLINSDHKKLNEQLKMYNEREEKWIKTVDDLKDLLNEQKLYYDERMKEFANTEKEIHNGYKEQLIQLQERLFSLEKQRYDLRCELDVTVSYRQEGVFKIDGFLKTMHKAMDAHVHRLRSERNQLRAEIIVQRDTICQLQSTLMATKKEQFLNTKSETVDNVEKDGDFVTTTNAATTTANYERQLETLELVLKSVRQELEIYKKENQMLSTEVENTGQALEEVFAKNNSILSMVLERERINIRLLEEASRRKLASETCKEEAILEEELNQMMHSQIDYFTQICEQYDENATILQNALNLLSNQYNDLLKQKSDYEKRVEQLEIQLNQIEENNKEYQSKLEEMSLILTKSQCNNVRLEFLENRFNEISSQKINQKTIPRRQYDLEKEVEILQFEIQDLRDSMKCSSCHLHSLDTVICKCFHVFCGECIRKRLEARHRKCPRCNASFGASDVHRVYVFAS